MGSNIAKEGVDASNKDGCAATWPKWVMISGFGQLLAIPMHECFLVKHTLHPFAACTRVCVCVTPKYFNFF